MIHAPTGDLSSDRATVTAQPTYPPPPELHCVVDVRVGEIGWLCELIDALPGRRRWPLTREGLRCAGTPRTAFVLASDGRMIHHVSTATRSAVVGVVVDDISGLSAYTAISAGARPAITHTASEGSWLERACSLVLDLPRSPVEPAAARICRVASDADRVVIDMLMAGLTTREIAERCYTSERSMYRRLRAMYARLGVTSRKELLNKLNGTAAESVADFAPP